MLEGQPSMTIAALVAAGRSTAGGANSGLPLIAVRPKRTVMSEFTDRLLILLIAVVGLGSLIIAWFGGFIVEGTSGMTQTIGLAVLVLLFIGAVIGVWHEFNEVDTERN